MRERELIRTRSFARVTGNLSLAASELSASIPPFNPQKLLADGVASTDDAPPAAEPDAEVSFVTCDLATTGGSKGKITPAQCDISSLMAKVKPSTLLPPDDILARVRDVANRAAAAGPLLGGGDPAAGPAGLKLSYAAEGDTDPYVGFEARVVPENITLLPKTSAASDWSEHAVAVKKGETVGSILRELGAAPEEIKNLIAVLGATAREGGIKEGMKLRVLTAATGSGHMQPLRVIIYSDTAIEAAVAISDSGAYVPVDVRNIAAEVADAAGDEAGDDDRGGVRLYQSIYETACATTSRHR